ncbi:MAG TPA: tetratricopeptide repeat protein [Roseiflexaceae bacterium]|nr:tetratricopeptide repeat protein [Roseiflexaceae bacterium]
MVVLVRIMWPFWCDQGHVTEGRVWLQKALQQPQVKSSTADHATLLAGAGVLAAEHSDYVEAIALLEQAVLLLDQRTQPNLLASTLSMLGRCLEVQGQPENAKLILQTSLNIHQSNKNKLGSATSLHHLGIVQCRLKEIDIAQISLEESIILFRLFERFSDLAIALNHLAEVHLNRNDTATARRLCAESITVPIPQPWFRARNEAFVLIVLGIIALLEQQPAEAIEHERRSLRIHRDMFYKDGMIWNLLVLGGAATALGQSERAARLFAAANMLQQSIGKAMAPTILPYYQRFLALAQQGCSQHIWEVAWELGAQMPLDTAIDYALSDA